MPKQYTTLQMHTTRRGHKRAQQLLDQEAWLDPVAELLWWAEQDYVLCDVLLGDVVTQLHKAYQEEHGVDPVFQTEHLEQVLREGLVEFRTYPTEEVNHE